MCFHEHTSYPRDCCSRLTGERTRDTTRQYPLHLLNLASVRDLETVVAKGDKMQHLDPRRFRANIISA
jgi:uncharacterized protein YcbX